MRRFRLALLITSCFLHSYLFADHIAMSNGDRLSGVIIKSDGKELVIKTEFAGEVTVKWSAITEINSTDPLHVAVREGQWRNRRALIRAAYDMKMHRGAVAAYKSE